MTEIRKNFKRGGQKISATWIVFAGRGDCLKGWAHLFGTV